MHNNIQEIIQRIKSYYKDYKLTNNGIYIGHKHITPDITMTFLFGHDKNAANFDALVEGGHILVVETKDIYMFEYNENEEEYFKRVNHYELKTENYFNETLDKIHYLSSKTCDPSEIPSYDFIEKIDMWINTTVTIGKVDNNYIAILDTFVMSEDDPASEVIYFSQKPNAESIRIIDHIHKLKYAFRRKYYGLSEQFTCSLCGNRTHWLDIKGNTFIEKLSGLKQCNCGCSTGDRSTPTKTTNTEIKTLFIGLDDFGEQIVTLEKTKEQIESARAYPLCLHTKEGTPLQWEKLDELTGSNPIFQLLLADRLLRDKALITHRANFAVLHLEAGKIIRLEYYEGQNSLELVYDLRRHDLYSHTLQNSLNQDNIYNPVSFLNNKRIDNIHVINAFKKLQSNTQADNERVFMFRRHFASITKAEKEVIQSKYGKRGISKFIRQIAYNDFSIELKTASDLVTLDNLITRNSFYKNRSEWLKVNIILLQFSHDKK